MISPYDIFFLTLEKHSRLRCTQYLVYRTFRNSIHNYILLMHNVQATQLTHFSQSSLWCSLSLCSLSSVLSSPLLSQDELGIKIFNFVKYYFSSSDGNDGPTNCKTVNNVMWMLSMSSSNYQAGSQIMRLLHTLTLGRLGLMG